MKAHNVHLAAQLTTNAPVKRQIILNGRRCKGASHWLTAIPCRWDDTEFDAASFRALLKYNIGFPLMNSDNKCPDCGKLQDKFGHHALSCKVASGAIDKHNSIVAGISSFLKKANIIHRVEEPNPLKRSRERPGDIFMPCFDPYGDAYFDVSVISICAESYFKKAAKGQLEGAAIRYASKMKKYPELSTRFKPLVIESTGGWHPFSFNYLKTLAEHISSRSCSTAQDILTSILRTCSVRLQRHQGTMLVRRCLGL